MPQSEKENLKREIGVRALALSILNATIGTGIFVIPAIIAESLGAAAIVAYLVCGVLIFLIALSLAELGSKTNISGGVYTYIETAFGPYAGFLANNIYLIGAGIISDAAVATGLADMLIHYFPFLGSELARVSIFALVFGGIALLNIRSVKYGVRFVELAAYGKLIPLLVIIITGAAFVSSKNLVWLSSPTVANIGTASLLLFFAFMGVETPLSNGGEIKNPKRTVPLAVFFGIAFVLLIYISIQLVTQGVLGGTLAAHKDAPLAATAGVIFGSTGVVVIVAISMISMLGNLGGEILSVPRMLFAGARDGIFPKMFARVHPKFFTPYTAIIVYTLLDLFFAIFGAFKQLAMIASASILIIYLGAVLASIKLRNTSPSPEKTFRIPGGPLVPLLAASAILWLLSNLTRRELLSILVFIILFSLIYLVTKLRKRWIMTR